MKEKRQSFFTGALILFAAGIAVKIIGALFKIPLAGAAGDEAMGYFSSAYSVYAVLFLISTAGLPAAVSRMIAAAEAEGNEAKARAVFRASLITFSGVGLLFSLALFFFAGPIAAIPGEKALAAPLRVLSPLIFFVCVSAAFRGYFQGRRNMIPTALSQVIEAAGNLALGLSFGVRAKTAGAAPAAVAAWVLAGIAVSAFFSLLFLLFAYRRASLREKSAPLPPKSLFPTAKELFSIAVPITFSGAVTSLSGLADSMLAVRLLKDVSPDLSSVASLLSSLSVSASPSRSAVAIYGAYAAKAVTLFSLTPTLVTPLAVSLLPAAGDARARGDEKALRETAVFALRAAMMIALPAAVGLAVLSAPIVRLLFPADEILSRTASGAAVTSHALVPALLSLLAPAIPFAAFVTVAGALLQGAGFEKKSIVSILAGASVKIVSLFFLAGDPRIGAAAMPLSTLLSYLAMTLFHSFFLARCLRFSFPVGAVCGKPALASLFCGGAAILSFRFLAARLSDRAATVAAVLFAALVYLAALILLKAVTPGDLRRFFSKRKKKNASRRSAP